jgi:hypothetical protein
MKNSEFNIRHKAQGARPRENVFPLRPLSRQGFLATVDAPCALRHFV